MCDIFGMFDYNEPVKQIKKADIVESPGHESAVRGTDATGIAYFHNGKITINKAAKSSYDFKFKLATKSKAVIGHTRLATQGSEKDNFNNHPFWGRCVRTQFAMAHNGIIYNDVSLRKKYNLPSTKIKTDSFIAVQLLEKAKRLNLETIQQMAEQLEGSKFYHIAIYSAITFLFMSIIAHNYISLL